MKLPSSQGVHFRSTVAGPHTRRHTNSLPIFAGVDECGGHLKKFLGVGIQIRAVVGESAFHPVLGLIAQIPTSEFKIERTRENALPENWATNQATSHLRPKTRI